MATLYTHQGSNIRKTWLLMMIFFIVVIIFGWFFSYSFNNSIILYFAVFISFAMNIGSYWYSDKIALKMSGATLADKSRFKDLHNIVENLSITAGLPKPKVYIIEDSSPNAFATGRNAENSAIAVTTGLLQILEKNELEGVIAHELSHIGNRDILISTIVVVLVGFIALLSDFFVRMSIFGGGSRDSEGRAGSIIFIVGLVLAILTPIVSVLIQLAISRKREFLADASGALLTRYPEGLANALKKISSNPNQLKRASKATAHMYISNPFKQKNVSKMFMTHPPVEERIKALLHN